MARPAVCHHTAWGLDLQHLNSFVSGFAEAPFISISDNQRMPLPELNRIDTIHHGLPERLLIPNLQAGRYLAFLGRFTPEKGPHVAIRLARQARLPLQDFLGNAMAVLFPIDWPEPFGLVMIEAMA